MLELNHVYNMDCLEGLKLLDSDSIHCCITSPPYWALRNYGVPGQIGQENTPAEYVERLCAVFFELYRILRPDGVFWLNISDTYCGTGNKEDYFDPKNPKGSPANEFAGQKKPKTIVSPELNPKPVRYSLADCFCTERYGLVPSTRSHMGKTKLYA